MCSARAPQLHRDPRMSQVPVTQRSRGRCSIFIRTFPRRALRPSEAQPPLQASWQGGGSYRCTRAGHVCSVLSLRRVSQEEKLSGVTCPVCESSSRFHVLQPESAPVWRARTPARSGDDAEHPHCLRSQTATATRPAHATVGAKRGGAWETLGHLHCALVSVGAAQTPATQALGATTLP